MRCRVQRVATRPVFTVVREQNVGSATAVAGMCVANDLVMDNTESPPPPVAALSGKGRPKGGWSLGRPFGVQIVADYSLLLIFGLITVSLATGVLPRWHPGWEGWLRWMVALAAGIAFIASIALHELSHALVAIAHGMKVRGIRLFMLGGVAQIEQEPPSAKVEFRMAIVGPLASLVIALASAWLGGALASMRAEALTGNPELYLASAGPLATVLLWLAPLNFALAIFNLIPGFPLDGGRVLRAALWAITDDLYKATRIAARVGQGFALLLISLGVFMLFGFVVPALGGGAVNGLWLCLIGWFLHSAAARSYEQILLRQALDDVPLREVMRSRVDTVSPETSVAVFVREYVMNSDDTAFPVVTDGAVVGLIQLTNVRSVPRDRWDETAVRDIMVPARELHLMAPQDHAIDALKHLVEHDPIPVVDHGKLVGVARRDDIIKWMALNASHPAGNTA